MSIQETVYNKNNKWIRQYINARENWNKKRSSKIMATFRKTIVINQFFVS